MYVHIYVYLEVYFSMVGLRCTRGAGQRMGKSATTFQWEMWVDLELEMDASCISISVHCFPLTQGLCVRCGVLLFLRVIWLFFSTPHLISVMNLSVPPLLLLCLEFSDLDFVFLF